MAITNYATNQVGTAETEEEKKAKAATTNTSLPYIQPTNISQPVALTDNAGGTVNTTATAIPQTPLAPMAAQVQQPTATQQATNQALVSATQQAQAQLQPSTLQTAITQSAQNLLANPTAGFDTEAYKQGQLSAYDLQQAQAYEALRQKNADIAGTGLWQKESLANQVESLRNRGELARTIDYENRDYTTDATIKALTASMQAEGLSQDTINNAIKNLISTYEATGIERQGQLDIQLANMDAATKKELMQLQASIDSQTLQKTQDFTAAESALERASQVALQKNDIEATKAIEQMKENLQLLMQKNEQSYNTSERVASQLYNTSERLDTQSYETTKINLEAQLQEKAAVAKYYRDLDMQSKEFDQEKTMAQIAADLDEAKANKDYTRTEALTKLQSALEQGRQDDAQEAQKELVAIENANEQLLQDKQSALELKMQTQDFSQEEKMAYLNAQLEDAKANKDVARQKDIIKFQTGEELTTMAAENGYDTALAELNNKLQLALQNDDQAATEALQETKLNFEAEQAAQDRLLEKARIDLQAKGVDMQLVDQQYNQIQGLVDQGILPNEALYEFIDQTLTKNGVDTSGDAYQLVDSQKAAQEALLSEYKLQQQQFIISHPEYLNNTYTIGGPGKDIAQVMNAASAEGDTELVSKLFGLVNSGKQSFTAQELYDMGLDYNTIDSIMTQTGTSDQIVTQGLSSMNDFLNYSLYGEETAAMKEEKATAGYLDETDLGTAAEGDKFNITKNTTYGGKSIPAGTYSVKQTEVGHGNKFFGTKYTNQHTYLVNNSTGKEIEIGTEKSDKEGNIVSNLWA